MSGGHARLRPHTFVCVLSVMGAMGCTDADAPATTDTMSADIQRGIDGFTPRPPPDQIPMLSPAAHLTRLSLDLRGIRPSVAEYDALEAALDAGTGRANALAPIIEDFLDDPRFSKRFQDLYAQVVRTRVETLPVAPEALGVADADRNAFIRAVGDEPLALLADIIARNAPLTELVTADHTMATPLLADAFPLARDAGPGWTRAVYVDGRPHAGWLTQNAFHWRYLSDGINYGRGRANAIARIFVCADFLSRPVDFPRDLDLTDDAAIKHAIRENRGCIGCHASLDPLASYLTGFQYADKTAAEMTTYHPARERDFVRLTGVAPSFYGEPGWSIGELGRQLAADPRFGECLARRGFVFFLGREPDPGATEDLDALTSYREALIAGGITARSLARAVVSSPLHGRADRERVVSPSLWASMLEDLTGFRFTSNDIDLLDVDLDGYLTLAGGADGRSGAGPSTTPTASMVLVWRRTAEAAASFVVNATAHPLFDATRPDVPLTGDIAENTVVRRQIASWHRRFFGANLDPSDDAVVAYAALMAEVHAATNDPKAAWTAVLTAFLRDPSLASY